MNNMKKTITALLFTTAMLLVPNQAKCQDSFIGELRLFPYGFAPRNWMACEGQLLSIQTNQALFSILGTYYGGNGINNFALPDLRGRAPIHMGSLNGTTVVQGQAAGTESETMTTAQLPAHTHGTSTATKIPCSSAKATTTTPGYYAAGSTRGNAYNSTTNAVSATAAPTVSTAGNSLPRNNVQPVIALRWCICVTGIYPARN